ncbi:MAG: bacillithiol biosynthesis BshC, partial [Gillisia sp.]
MPSECISYSATNNFSKLILDYLDEKEELKAFYHHFPKIESFEAQMAEKKKAFPSSHRQVLAAVLQNQYSGLDASEATQKNIELLKSDDTFTVTTGHQLNLFTGPLYFLYKIVSAINLAKALSQKYPEKKFVPVYWMATED